MASLELNDNDEVVELLDALSDARIGAMRTMRKVARRDAQGDVLWFQKEILRIDSLTKRLQELAV